MRKFISSQTGASMTTEYQDRFLPPHHRKAVVSTTTQKHHYHPLRGTSNDTSTYRSFYVTNKRLKHPRRAPQPPKVRQQCSSTPHGPAASLQNRHASQLEDYTSVYKSDFRGWNTNKRQCFRREPAQTAADTRAAPQQKQWPPFEGITSYRSDYVTHLIPPRAPAPSFTKKVSGDKNRQPYDGAGELFKHFHSCSLKASRGKDGACSEPADVTILSTTRAHYTAHKCQRTRPILPPVNTSGTSKEPFQAMTTTREDYRAWDTAGHVPARTEGKKATLSAPAHGCGASSKSHDLPLKWKETSVCKTTKKPQHRAAETQTFCGFHSISCPACTGALAWTEESPGLTGAISHRVCVADTNTHLPQVVLY